MDVGDVGCARQPAHSGHPTMAGGGEEGGFRVFLWRQGRRQEEGRLEHVSQVGSRSDRDHRNRSGDSWLFP